MMSEMQVVKTLVPESLSAAAEQIVHVVERMIATLERKMLHTSDMQKQLSVAADEIFRILENLMSKYEAEVSKRQCKSPDITLQTNVHKTDRLPLSAPGCDKDISTEQQKCEQCRISSRDQDTSARPQFKDAATETDPEFIYSKPSHLHQTQSTGKNMSSIMETQGEQCGVLPSDQKIPSPDNSEVMCEDTYSDKNQNKSFKSNKMRTCQRLRQSQVADCFHMDVAEEKNKMETRKIAPKNKSQTTGGQSCCRVCGKCFWYKRSFLKHVLKHEQSTDLSGVSGKHLDTVKSSKVHLQVHNEENGCRDKPDDKQSSTECSDAESKVDVEDEDWKESEGTDSDSESDKKTNKGSCSRKTRSETKIQAPNTPKRAKNSDCKDLLHCCKVCGKSFCYRASFLKHVQQDERNTDVCGVCGKCFESEESLRLHLQTYIRTNDCEFCGKHFDGIKQLEMHTRTHTGEKPYICSVCGKAFAQNGNLMGHMRTHTGEKLYVCSLCGRSFSFKDYMMAHMRIHTGEKPFLCSVCGKGFRQRGTLNTHMMIHTGETTHRCVICDKKFYKSGALKIHMRSHTGETPYQCNVCEKSFTSGSSLTNHMRVHEDERTHCRSVCKGSLKKELTRIKPHS